MEGTGASWSQQQSPPNTGCSGAMPVPSLGLAPTLPFPSGGHNRLRSPPKDGCEEWVDHTPQLSARHRRCSGTSFHRIWEVNRPGGLLPALGILSGKLCQNGYKDASPPHEAGPPGEALLSEQIGGSERKTRGLISHVIISSRKFSERRTARGEQEHQVTRSRKRGPHPGASHAPACNTGPMVPAVGLVPRQPSQAGFAPRRELVLAYSLQSYKHTKDNLSPSSKRKHGRHDQVGISSRSEPKISRSETRGQRAGGTGRGRGCAHGGMAHALHPSPRYHPMPPLMPLPGSHSNARYSLKFLRNRLIPGNALLTW